MADKINQGTYDAARRVFRHHWQALSAATQLAVTRDIEALATDTNERFNGDLYSAARELCVRIGGAYVAQNYK